MRTIRNETLNFIYQHLIILVILVLIIVATSILILIVVFTDIQLNLSTTATLGTEESGRCGEVAVMGR